MYVCASAWCGDVCVLSIIKLSSIPSAFLLDCKVALTEKDNAGKGKCYLK